MKNRRPGLSKASTKWNAWGMLLLVIWLTGWTGFGIAQEKKTGPEPLAPVLPIPQPQFFCGSCHILTYPEIIKEQTALWKNSRHNQVGCVKCHYAPEKSPRAGSETAAKHLPIQPPEHFTHLKLGGPIVQTRPRIDDATCMSADCHGKAGDDFKTRKIKFTAKVNFVHEPHFAAANQVGGLKPGCTTCHQHETNQKKFEVTPTTCFLCHFMGTKLNDGKGRCELCHTLPEGPIQGSAAQTGGKDAWGSGGGSGGGAWGTEPAAPAAAAAPAVDEWGLPVKLAAAGKGPDPRSQPVTHAMIQQAGVSCASCHFDLVQSGTGAMYNAFFEKGILKTAVVYGVGRIKKENCLACHDKAEDIRQALAMDLMHQRHVSVKNATCLDCHQPVIHMKANLADRTPQDDDPVLMTGCITCHPLPHYYQRILTSGTKGPAQEPAPDPMYRARVNCFGCHNRPTVMAKGQTVFRASGDSCVFCHEKAMETTLKDWERELNDRIKTVAAVSEEVLRAFEKIKTKISGDRLTKMMENLSRGLENFKIVKFGNGVHNHKYAKILLDEAVEIFRQLNQDLAAVSGTS